MKKICCAAIGMFLINLTFVGLAASAAKRPTTVAELALYKGDDRQQILEEGAKKEGKLMFYTSGILTQAVRPVVDSFEKKYPFIKVEVWRAGSETLVPRVVEEFKAGKLAFDALENTQHGYLLFQDMGGILQPYYSPNLAFIEEGAITKAPKGGVLRAGFRESGHGLGYNTKLISKADIPKSYKDLLDPKWKGKAAIAGSENGVSFAGTVLEVYGEDFLTKLSAQNFDVHMVSARAILDMIINGEYLFSPTITDAHVSESKKAGAPVDWVPLEPSHVNVGQIGLSTQARNPHAAMLFIDHELSKEVGEIHKARGYISPRTDVTGEQKYKKNYGPNSSAQALKWKGNFNKYFLKK